MAEENDGASKTEDATPRKLEEARRKGDVAKTPDIGQLLSLAGATGVMAIGGGYFMQRMTNELRPFIERPQTIHLDGAAGVEVLRHAGMAAAPILLAVLMVAAILGAFGNLIQTGFLWAPDKLNPDLKRVSPLAGFKRVYSIEGLVEFIKSVLKITAVGAVCWWILKPRFNDMAGLSALEPTAILPFAGDLLRALFFSILALLAVTGGADWLWQRYRFLERMKMSKEELKQDIKNADGDPHIKAKLRQIRMERSRRRMMQAVPKATVVVMNPTHYAVALFYEAGASAAPTCVAKGLDGLALKIREVAEEAGVPVIEDPPLARALYAAIDIDEPIPTAHYEAVAKIIGFIMNRKSGAPRRAGAL